MGRGCFSHASRGDAYSGLSEGPDVSLSSIRNLPVTQILLCSFGTKRWDGTSIDVGYTALIGNKEIEVDSRISKHDMPVVAGTSPEYENELEFGSPAQTQALCSVTSPSRAQQPHRVSSEKQSFSALPERSAETTKKYVAPTSFYARPPPKPKPKGPL